MLRQMRYTATAMVFALSPLSIQTAHADAEWREDPVVLSFSTVGDSRQDSLQLGTSILSVQVRINDDTNCFLGSEQLLR